MSAWAKVWEKLFDISLVEAGFYLIIFFTTIVVVGDLFGWDTTGSLLRAAGAFRVALTSLGCLVNPAACCG